MADGILNLRGGRQPLPEALSAYESAWQRFAVQNGFEDFLESLPPVTIGWKVADKAALFANLEYLSAQTCGVHIGLVDGRFIATVILQAPYHGMCLVKILERKAGAADPLGLDSVDYLIPSGAAVYDRLASAIQGRLKKQRNDHHVWLSLRFGDDLEYEAKFMDHLVLKVAQAELAEQEQKILHELGIR